MGKITSKVLISAWYNQSLPMEPEDTTFMEKEKKGPKSDIHLEHGGTGIFMHVWWDCPKLIFWRKINRIFKVSKISLHIDPTVVLLSYSPKEVIYSEKITVLT
uniref:Uncharacterized protein n=1 Tax=Chelonoidis abingdonii TaxID=106734 RepID=A0A8C0GHQ9_CHEAB